MSSNRSLTIILTGAILLAISWYAFWLPTPAFAQCEEPEPSTCTSCHEIQDPVIDKGEWHSIHANKDICIKCHGGNALAIEKDLAHQGLTAHPLEDIYTDCHSCHPDYDARAARFASTLGVTPGSCATPTTVAASNISSGPPSGNIVIPSNMESTSAAQAQSPFVIITGGLLTLAIFILGLNWLARHPTAH